MCAGPCLCAHRSPEMGAKIKEPDFTPQQVGTFSCHGVEPGHRQGETSAKINQDRGCFSCPYAEYATQGLFAVYDGHGANGDKVSEYVYKRVADLIAGYLLEMGPFESVNPSVTAKIHDLMKKSFVQCDTDLRNERGIDAELSGTTAVAMLIRELPSEPGVLHTWTAWTGDSRAVLYDAANKKTIDMTDDHKPDTPLEMERIKKAGGFVSPPEEEWGGPARVWLDPEMTLPGLAMARSIGDHLVKSVGVTAEPECRYLRIDQGSDKSFIILASDGVWEFITSSDATKLVEKHLIEKNYDSTVRARQSRVAETAHSRASVHCLSCMPAPPPPPGLCPHEPPRLLPHPTAPRSTLPPSAPLYPPSLSLYPLSAFVPPLPPIPRWQHAVTKLIETSAAKWRQEEGDYRDDITAICVQLPGLFAGK